MADITILRKLAKDLNLWNIARGRIDLLDERVSNLDYLQAILENELELRSRNKTTKLRKACKLPSKIFQDKNLSAGLKWQIRQLANFDWLDESQNIFLLGSCSTGKTSLAVKIAESAIAAGRKTFYTSFDNLIIIAEQKDTHAKSGAIFSYMRECDLVIVDDLFYVAPTRAELQIFYRMIIFLSETRSILLITNRKLSDWPAAVDDQHLCQTLVDRLTANSQIIRLTYDCE